VWLGDCERREAVLGEPRDPQGPAAVGELFALMAAGVPDGATSAADEVIVWECRQRAR